jgi:hypothetical protein
MISDKKYSSDSLNINTNSNNFENGITDTTRIKEEYLINLEGLIKGNNFSSNKKIN